MAKTIVKQTPTSPTPQSSKSKLTYERLIAKLSSSSVAIAEQYPEAKDSERVKAIQAALQATIDTAQAGLSGDKSVISPGALKHEITAEIQKIHQNFHAAARIIRFAELAEQHRQKSSLEIWAAETEAGSSNAVHDEGTPLVSPGMLGAATILQSLSQQEQKSVNPVDKSVVKNKVVENAPVITDRQTRRTSTPKKRVSINQQTSESSAKGKHRATSPTTTPLYSSPVNGTKRSYEEATVASASTSSDQASAVPSPDDQASSPKRVKFDTRSYIALPTMALEGFRNMSKEDIFLSGVRYGVENVLQDMCETFDKSKDFYNFVTARLGVDNNK